MKKWTWRWTVIILVSMLVGACTLPPTPPPTPTMTPSGGGGGTEPGQEAPPLLPFDEALKEARAELVRAGYREVALGAFRGSHFGADGRALWEFTFCERASGKAVFYSFREEDPQPRVDEGASAPLGLCAYLPRLGVSLEEVLDRNPRFLALAREKAAEAALMRPSLAPEQVETIKKYWAPLGVTIHNLTEAEDFVYSLLIESVVVSSGGLDVFLGPVEWYTKDEAWWMEVEYPVEFEDDGRPVVEGCIFWVALGTGLPLYEECSGVVYDESGRPVGR